VTDEQKLAVLWDERLIQRRIIMFGRCLDTGDWAAWRSCFTDRITADFKRLTGQDEVAVAADEWVALIARALAPMRRHHSYANFDISLHGDRAHAVVYHTSRHWAPTDIGVSYNTQYGWYDFHLEHAGDDWLINGYKHDFQWVDGNAGVLNVADPAVAELTAKVFVAENFAAARAVDRY
jgi:hypothetical protein